MYLRCLTAFVLLMAANAHADVVSYEATSFPEQDDNPWDRTTFCTPERWIEDGWLFQNVESGQCEPPPSGDKDRYERSLSTFAGEQAFFIEWRMVTDGPSSEFLGVAPASVVTGNVHGVLYHFTIAADLVRFLRDVDRVLFVDIEPAVAHTYRLELYGEDLYRWYVNGQVVDSGVSDGPYPTADGVLAWRAKSVYTDSTTQWDYIRYGTSPVEGSGDYDSSEGLNPFDYYFVHECLLGPDIDAGPGCRFADFDFDTDVDLTDFAAFQNAFTGAP